jgi:hypothetical protein
MLKPKWILDRAFAGLSRMTVQFRIAFTQQRSGVKRVATKS